MQLQTRQWLEGNELKAEYSILKVYRHEPGPEQQKLQLSRNDETDGGCGRKLTVRCFVARASTCNRDKELA